MSTLRMPKRREYAREALLTRAKRLVRLLETDDPVGVLVAKFTWDVVQSAFLWHREAMAKEMGEIFASQIFRSAAYCTGTFHDFGCEEPVDASTSHPVRCPTCRLKEETELRKLGVNDPDPDLQ